MAGLLGEGGIILLSGSFNSAAPATLADFRVNLGLRGAGVDGRPCNIYQLTISDTSGTYLLAVRVQGLQENSTTSKAMCIPGIPQQFQVNEHANNLYFLQGWLTDINGANLTGSATANSTTVSGFVLSRRE